MTVRSNPMGCPHCGKHIDRQSGHGNTHPKPGDIGICWGCKGLMVFALTPVGLMLRLPTEEEQRDAATHPQLRTLLKSLAIADDPGHAERMFQDRQDEWKRP